MSLPYKVQIKNVEQIAAGMDDAVICEDG
jgi:hypothetical protein